MKKIFLALMAAVICTGAFAQGPQGGQRREFNPEDFAKRQAERIQQTTGADAKQTDALYNFFLRQMKNMPRPQMQGQQGQRPSEEEMQARRAEMEKRQQAQNDSIRAILTADQFAKYEEAQKEWRQRGPQGGQRGQYGQGGQRPQGGQGPQYGQGGQRPQPTQPAQPDQKTKKAKKAKKAKK